MDSFSSTLRARAQSDAGGTWGTERAQQETDLFLRGAAYNLVASASVPESSGSRNQVFSIEGYLYSDDAACSAHLCNHTDTERISQSPMPYSAVQAPCPAVQAATTGKAFIGKLGT